MKIKRVKDENCVSTLEANCFIIGRMEGNTTRQVDFAIYQLFKGKHVIVQDHYNSGKDLRANSMLLKRIQNRVYNEKLIGSHEELFVGRSLGLSYVVLKHKKL